MKYQHWSLSIIERYREIKGGGGDWRWWERNDREIADGRVGGQENRGDKVDELRRDGKEQEQRERCVIFYRHAAERDKVIFTHNPQSSEKHWSAHVIEPFLHIFVTPHLTFDLYAPLPNRIPVLTAIPPIPRTHFVCFGVCYQVGFPQGESLRCTTRSASSRQRAGPPESAFLILQWLNS